MQQKKKKKRNGCFSLVPNLIQHWPAVGFKSQTALMHLASARQAWQQSSLVAASFSYPPSLTSKPGMKVHVCAAVTSACDMRGFPFGRPVSRSTPVTHPLDGHAGQMALDFREREKKKIRKKRGGNNISRQQPKIYHHRHPAKKEREKKRKKKT